MKILGIRLRAECHDGHRDGKMVIEYCGYRSRGGGGGTKLFRGLEFVFLWGYRVSGGCEGRMWPWMVIAGCYSFKIVVIGIRPSQDWNHHYSY